MTDKQPDPLDVLLAAPPMPDDGHRLREQILARGIAVLRRRRRVKQLAWVASLAACYLAGILTMQWSRPTPPVAVVATIPTTPTPDPKETPPAQPSALAAEWQALDSTDKEHRGKLYREAADRYFNDRDPVAAVRCYSIALDEAKPDELTVSTEDNFLLIALKQAREKEKRHARDLD